MGNDGSSASGMDGIDCLCNRDGLAGNVVGTFFADIDIHCLADRGDDVQMHEIAGDVDPVVIAGIANCVRIGIKTVHRDSALSDAGILHFFYNGLIVPDLGHFIFPDHSAQGLKSGRGKIRGGREITQYVDLRRFRAGGGALLRPACAQLDPVYSGLVVLMAGFAEGVDPRECVVIREGDQTDSGSLRFLHELVGSICPV